MFDLFNYPIEKLGCSVVVWTISVESNHGGFEEEFRVDTKIV